MWPKPQQIADLVPLTEGSLMENFNFCAVCCAELFLSSTKSFHRYFRMKYRDFLTSQFILFTQRSGQSQDLTCVCLTFKR